jgi:DNA-binding MarR family transcriptional regulator
MPDDAQLEQLLTQLLRAVSPTFGAQAPEKPASRPAIRAAGGPVPGESGSVVMTAAQTEAYAVPGAARPSGTGASGAEPDAGLTGRVEADAKLPSVSGSEARALIELMSARGIAQGELAGLLGLDKSTVSRLAAGLERKGWVRRGRDEDNQRYVRLYLTAEGGAIAARVLHAWHSRQARILAALSDDERIGLSAGLRGLVRGLTAEGLLGESGGNRT